MKLDAGTLLQIYALTAVVFFVIDLFWLGVVAKDLYARHIGVLLREQVNWPAAVIFYAIYIGGIVLFVLVPALRDGTGTAGSALLGGALGFFAYCTFDLTCLALFRQWSLTITIVDILWGTFLTGATSAVSAWLTPVLLRLN